MAPRIYTFRPPTNPLLQVLYFLVGGVLLIGVIFMGAIVLTLALGVALVAGLIIYVRVWWLKRKLARSGKYPGPESAQRQESEVIEVEYTVVDERDERDK